ncbi:MAG: tripartite tricarboxylate transporter substrate binding protein [Polaromonas sp.]|nr:tripartite tricarboxylate transporter substrate binding protein [Polaromonas sp.]
MKKTLSAFSLSLFFSTTAMAAFPDKPVKIIVSNPPGGPVDVMLRVLSNRLSTVWGQPVVVENKPGASGIVSSTALIKSPPDGYTLGMFVASAITIMPFAVDSLPYDPVKDMQPISLVARTPFVFVVAQNSPLKTWNDFVQQAGKLDMSMGSLSVGTAFHLVWEQTARQAGIKALYVPSPSSGKTQLDLMGGLLDVVLDAPSSAKGLIDSGKLRALAITSPERFSGLPNTPTLNEAGLKGYSSQPWIGLMAPAGLPADRVAQIQATVAAILKEPAMKTQMETLGMIPVGSSPEELAATIQKDRKDMEPLVKRLGIKLQ